MVGHFSNSTDTAVLVFFLVMAATACIIAADQIICKHLLKSQDLVQGNNVYCYMAPEMSSIMARVVFSSASSTCPSLEATPGSRGCVHERMPSE